MFKFWASRLLVGLGVVVLISISEVYAQLLSADEVKMPKPSVTVKKIDKEKTENKKHLEYQDEVTSQINEALVQGNKNASDNPLDQISQALDEAKEVSKSGKSAEAETGDNEEDIFIPEGELYKLNSPTLDGSVRGGQVFVEVDEKGRMKKVSKIFIYYDQFEMANFLSNEASCNVRFNVLSNLDQKINRLDVKLVWPGLTTTLSFSDVAPNTQTYYNYSLLGNGCYDMDKAPNIIVNRCRVKGMTAAECANKIVWLSK